MFKDTMVVQHRVLMVAEAVVPVVLLVVVPVQEVVPVGAE
tara:strand:- start:218 stop:337 length:120 start_codon:yes stop_codon:yes gene_type:complete